MSGTSVRVPDSGRPIDPEESPPSVGHPIHHAARLDQIVEVQRAIADAGLDLQAVMQITMERSQLLSGADGAMVNLIDGEDMVVRGAIGIAAPVLDDRRPLSTTLLRYAIASRRPVLVSDSRTDPRINQTLQSRVKENSIICVPFFSGDRVVGSLNVVKRSLEQPLNEDDRQTLELLGGILSASVSHAAEFEAKRSEVEALARFQTIFDGAPIGIARIRLADAQAVEVNPALTRMLGYSTRELLDSLPFSLNHPDDSREDRELHAEMARGSLENYQVEKRFRSRNGESIWVHIGAAVERESGQRPEFAIMMIQDITERRQAEEQLRRQAEITEHQATHDALTGLANRALFRVKIEGSLGDAARSGMRAALMMLDLDRFKDINDSLGHHAGDAVLTQIASRLRGAVRGTETIARLGGDEFGLLVPDVRDVVDLAPIAQRILRALEGPVLIEGVELTVDASIGIAVYPDDAEDPDTMLQLADVAMYRAKADQSGYTLYDSGFDDNDSGKLGLLGELRRALSMRELVLHYQPKVAMGSNEVASVEALVRWQHPTRGLLSPFEFIPAAERSELIKPLTLYVIDESLRQCQEWETRGWKVAVAVNVSTRNLLNLDFPDKIAELLAKWGLSSSRLSLEITESTMLGEKRSTRVLRQLEALGIRLSIDDFGTGYCSLVHLRNLPISEIKIDRSFVSRMDDPRDASIVGSIIDLGRNLGIDVVAEGVETLETWNQLVALDCPYAQGYLFCRPQPGDALLARWTEGVTPAAAPPPNDRG
jgi:diguanylate cyclase (GGDEF)-like protein/PAS domain S-box-containing protein